MKIFKSLIIPLILVIGYLLLVSYPYVFSKINRFDSLGILSLIEDKSENIIKTGTSGEPLLKGEKIKGELTSSENNLGIVLVRFLPLSPKVTDRVMFRIKERREKKWYYENNYNANQFQPDSYFTFGFPVIEDSKNKIYTFEIESLAGMGTNGIGLSSVKPQTALVYKFTKEKIKDINLFRFIIKKFIYIKNNMDVWQNLPIFILVLFVYLFIYFLRMNNISFTLKEGLRLEKPTFKFLSRQKELIKSSGFYALFFNTQMKKRAAIGLLLFFIALLYRFSQASIDKLGVSSFYATLGVGGDYDQFIRAATCALKLCPSILGQNFLFESSVLGIFYGIFGFIGGLRAYLYLMIILSSIIATLPYLLLSRKNWITVGGIIGSLFLATSDYFTNMALALPPDNGSLFLFSIFYIVYLCTISIGTIRWLLFFGFMGTIDGLNKLTFLLNDSAVLAIFAPVFYIEKSKKTKKFPFFTFDVKLIFYSLLPFLVFLIIYCAWEIFVQIKFGMPYYYRALIQTGAHNGDYIPATSFNEKLALGNILERFYYYSGSTIVLLKRITQNAGLNALFLTPLLFGLLFMTFKKPNFFKVKLYSIIIFSAILSIVLILFRNNYLNIQQIEPYAYLWPTGWYVNVFLLVYIIFLIFVNFTYKGFKFTLPIITYVIMLDILTKNAPWVRLLAHAILWCVILFSFVIDWILTDSKVLKKLWISNIILILFIFFYMLPKTLIMVENLYSGFKTDRNEVAYLQWVNRELPKNTVILAGGKSDLVTIAQNVKRLIIYNTLWTEAVFISPEEKLPRLDLVKWNITSELKNKNNFNKNKYIILDDDIYLWRGRIAEIGDNLFSPSSMVLLHGDDYSVKVYRFNSALNKGIYELELREPGNT